MTDNKKTVNTNLFLSILKSAEAESLAKVVAQKKTTGKKSEGKSKVKTVGATASKVEPLEQSNDMHDLLLKIYGFLKQSNENKLKLREKENNFKEENELERAKRHKELMDALNKIKSDTDTATKIEEDTGMGMFDIVTSILGAFGGAKSALSLLTNIGKFFIFNPFGAALLLGTATISMLINDKNPEQTNQMLQNALNPAAEGQTVAQTIRDTTTIEKRKQNLLADRPSSKKSYINPVKDADLQQKYLEEIGFDESTGLTEAERKAGFIGLDEKGKPTKQSTTKVETAIQQGGTSNAPNGGGGSTPSTQSSEVSASSGLTSGESIVTPVNVPAESERLNSAIKENVVARLEDSLSPGETVVVNNSSSSASMASGSTDKPFLPAVRNLEPTFQRMILDSTRIV